MVVVSMFVMFLGRCGIDVQFQYYFEPFNPLTYNYTLIPVRCFAGLLCLRFSGYSLKGACPCVLWGNGLLFGSDLSVFCPQNTPRF